MAFRKATFEITADTFGQGTVDVRFRPNSTSRPARLLYVEMTAVSGGNPLTTLYETVYDDVDLVYDYGDQLFFSPGLGDGVRRFPEAAAVVDDVDVAVSSGETGEIYVDSKYVRCDVDGLNTSGTCTVVVGYETAGDYRF